MSTITKVNIDGWVAVCLIDVNDIKLFCLCMMAYLGHIILRFIKYLNKAVPTWSVWFYD